MSDKQAPASNTTVDPNDLYSLDDFLAEDDILDDLLDEATGILKASVEALQDVASDHRLRPRKSIKRAREESHQQLWNDYFSENPLYSLDIFRRRFRMSRPLFLHIVAALGQWSSYFTAKSDAVNRQGLSPLQKCTAAIRELANGSTADHLDEYLKISDTTALEATKKFVEGVIAIFGGQYLRRPTMEDVERLLKVSESRGFLGMLGSIDFMHWQWERPPYAWKGQSTQGDQKVPTIILEAVAAGSNKDINVLSKSNLFIEELKGQAPRVQYMINGNQYNMGYYLADGAYPKWAIFVKSIRMPITAKDKLFAEHQEVKRKDIERAFGVLQHRWCILKQPARLNDQGLLEKVVLACIILHNMIVEDEKEEDIEENLDLNEPPHTSTVAEPEFSPQEFATFERVLEKTSDIEDRSTHFQIQNDLIEHIWQKFGP